MDFVGRLPRLKKLMMWNVQVSDEGVARLKDLKELRYIHIDDARIGDASLAVLATLLRLEGMASLGNDFTDQGLASLQEMTQLREFVIRLDGLPKDASWGCVWEFDPKATGWAGGAAGYEQGKQAGELGMVFRHAAQGREPSEGPSRHRDGAMGDGGREGRQATMPVC